MRLSTTLASAVLAFGTLFASYSMADTAASSATASKRSGEGMTIVFDTGGPVGGPYNTIVQNGARQACEDLGCSIKFMYSDWSPRKMIENFSKALATRPDGMVIMGHPGDEAYGPLVKEARDNGILVTSTDTELPELMARYSSEGFGYTGPDNLASGKQLAQEALRRTSLKAGERALVWGLKSVPNRGLSTQGMLDVLEAAGINVDYMEISAEVDKDPTLGLPLMTAYLSRNPNTRLIMIDHGALTAQMENFLRAAGVKPDQVFVTGGSLSPATAGAVKGGYIDLISDGQPFLQGYLPVVQLVMTKRYGFSGLKINTGGGFISRDNIDVVAPLVSKGLR